MIDKASAFGASAKTSQPASEKSEIGWAQIGENVSKVLDMTRRGEREKVVSTFAAYYDTYPNRIWKCVAAADLINKLDDRRLRRLLPQQPLTVVELLVLWEAHDHDGALKAAHELVEGTHTYRSLKEAERAARPKSVSTVSSRAQAWHAAVSDALLAGPAKGVESIAAPDRHAGSPADLWLRHRKGGIGVQCVGAFQHARDYNRAIPFRIYAGMGIAHAGFGSWIVLPVDTAGARYKEEAERRAPDVLKIFELELPAYEDL